MAGFGKPQQSRKIKRQAITSKTEEAIRQSLIAYQQGDLVSAKTLLDKTIEAHQANSFALGLLATIEKALGNNERASQLFEKSIGIDQNNPDILHNYSALLQEKDPMKVVKISDKALEISPDNSKYLERNGYLKWKAGDLDNALKATIKAIGFKPDLIDAHVNLGGIYKDLGNLDLALASTLKSLELKPNDHTALMNLGGIYKELDDLDQALDSTLKSLELKPDNPTAHMNLGGIYQDLGNLDQSLASTLKSLELKPDNPTAHMNLGMLYETSNELSSALQSHTQSAKLIAHYKDESSLTSLISTSIILLQMNRIKDAEIALSNALGIAHNKEIPLKPTSKKNKKHNGAYLSYLSKLIPEIQSDDSPAKAKILHLGESHCLTFTNQTIEVRGKECTIKPCLIKGAKAFHLSEESKTNPQKIGFEMRLRQSLDDYEYIFLSFGEIDCREDEGILLHRKKTGKAIQDISKITAINYYNWTVTSLSRYKNKIVYFGTPAPFKTNLNSDETSKENEERLLAITVFNTTLAKQCQESGVLFADVYKLTAGKDGYNNNEWMIDPIHLKPKALNELINSLENSSTTIKSFDCCASTK